MKGTRLVRLAATLGFLMFPFLASAADCWLRDGAAPTPTNLIMLCQQGRVYISTDGGGTWTPRETKAKAPARAMAFSDVNRGIVVGDGGLLFGTEDGGKTWTERLNAKGDQFTTEHLQTVFALGNRIWAAGFDGIILASTDGGRTFVKQESGTTFGLEGIFFADQDHGWAVGWSGCILKTDNGGAKWQNVSSKSANWSLGWVYFKDLKNGWTTGFNGQMLRSQDGGATWTPLTSPSTASLKSIAMDNAQRLWIATDEQLLMSRDGVKWEIVEVPQLIFMRRMLPVGDKLWAVGQLGIFQQSGDGTKWTQLDSLVTSGSTTETVYKKAAGSN